MWFVICHWNGLVRTVCVSVYDYLASLFLLFSCSVVFYFLSSSLLDFADLLLVSAVLMELAAQSSKGIKKDVLQLPEELSPFRFSSCCS